MTIRDIPGAPEGQVRSGVSSQISSRVIARWHADIRAAADDTDERTIGIYDVIGDDYLSDGVTSKRIASALRRLGAGPVTVSINSPGGDIFEAFAIYNLLREHKGEVTVKVLGLAASAASVIAMTGDTLQIARAGFLMIHNAWVFAVGNRLDLRAVADTMESFDRSIADIYALRTGCDSGAMQTLMDAETWIAGSEAVAQGFADELLPSDQIERKDAKVQVSAVRRIEMALRASGMPKSEAMRLISQFKSGAGDPVGSGEGDPTELKRSAAIAASLTDILTE